MFSSITVTFSYYWILLPVALGLLAVVVWAFNQDEGNGPASGLLGCIATIAAIILFLLVLCCLLAYNLFTAV